MSESFTGFMIEVANLVILIAALSLMFRYEASVSDNIVGHRSIIYEESNGAVLEKMYPLPETIIVSYAEVMAMLIDRLEFDVKLDTIYIKKESFIPEEFDKTLVGMTDFVKEVVYDNGEILYISFTPLK